MISAAHSPRPQTIALQLEAAPPGWSPNSPDRQPAARPPFSASEKRALAAKPVVELLAASLPAAALYFWCRNSPLETMIPGVLQGPALSARALLAANYNRPAEETDAALSELDRRGLVIVDESGAAPVLYLPEKLAELCSAPTTLKQIPGWVAQLRRLGALRARVQADALAVTARADEERAVRRKDGAQSLFDLLKKALGITLHPLPSAAAEQQLSLSLPAPLCAVPGPLAQSAEQRLCKPQAEGSTPLGTSMPEKPTPKGDFLDYFEASDRTEGRRPVAAEGGNASAELPRHAGGPTAGGTARTGVHPGTGRGHGPVEAGRRGRAAFLRDAPEPVSGGVRKDSASPTSSRLDRFIEKSRIDGVARILRSPVADDAEREQVLFEAAIKRTGAAQADLDEMARIAQATFPWWERGIALDRLCLPIGWSNKTDLFAQLLTKARTPALRPKKPDRIHPAARVLLEGIADELEKETGNGRQ